MSFSRGQFSPIPGVERQLELNPTIAVPAGTLRVQDVLDGATRGTLRERAFRWVKGLGTLPVRGHPLRSLFRQDGLSYWWWCETPVWEGWGDGTRFPGAVRVAWTVEAVRRLSAGGAHSLRIVGSSRAGLLRAAVEVAKADGIPAEIRTRARGPPALPPTLKLRLMEFALNRRRGRWGNRRLEPGATVFVTYATRVRIARGGEDANLSVLSRELEKRGKPWRAVVVDNAADAARPWRRSLEAVPSGYEPLEGLVSAEPAARSCSTAKTIAERVRAAWDSISPRFAWDGLPLAAVYAPIFRVLLTTHVPAGAYYFWAFREILERSQPARLVILNETGYAGRGAVAAGNAVGVPTVGLQHGVIAPGHIEYIHDEEALRATNPDACPIPVRTLLDGRYYREVLERASAYPSGGLVVCGAPRYDTFLGKFRAQSGVAPEYVTLVTQPIDDLATVRSVFRVVMESEGVRLAVRPHPLEDATRYGDCLRELGIEAPIFAHEDLAEVLARSMAVIAPFSTAVVEANLADRPVAVLNLGGEPDYVPYVERGGAIGVRDLAELPGVIRDFVDHGLLWRRLSDSRQSFLEDFASTGAEDSASRMADAIVSLEGDLRAGNTREEKQVRIDG